jgi:cyclic beta-1,2-glucan synthetase
LRSPEAPIRAELFSVERLEQHAESLAAAQRIGPNRRRGNPLAKRLYNNARALDAAYRAIARTSSAHRPITPAARWLMGSFHIVDEQIREIKDDLPPGYYRLLPKLTDGPLQGYPRVSGIAWALVAHTDSAFDLQKLTRFVDAYQRVQPLTIGELWALVITLRITLVENLRRLADAIVARLAESQLADTLADRILGTAKGDPEPASTILQNLDEAPWSTAFAVELSQRLRDRDPDATPALRWLDDRLRAEGTTTDQIVRDEFRDESANEVTVRNVVIAMRLVSTINWPEFFESVSPVDKVLRRASEFGTMDFPTRDTYRRAIEELARESGRDELEVAEHATAAAKPASDRPTKRDGDARRESDPGYYLIAEGRRAFEKELGCRVPLKTRLFRFNSDLGVTSYVGMIAIVAALVLALALLAVAHVGIVGWALLVLGIVGLVPASDVAVAIVNRAIAQCVGGTILPGLELRDGVRRDMRTIVVVPTLLVGLSAIEKQIERLEVHHLSSPDENFFFALLSDWSDSATEHNADDESLLDEAAAGVARLNTHYALEGGGARFFLLHRRRVWNEGEGMWMGWERKRGKLHELNGLLRGATDTTFMAIDGHVPSLPSGIRFVITLDADTRLPIGAARRLVGKMAHPLNQPNFDSHAGVVVSGHGILQPRVTPSLPMGSEGSLFQRTFSGPNGLDPYAMAVSDVYQDMFGEGSYCGKGIYEIESFEAALEGQIPENSILSHDLLEGVFARAGLASDIEVVEEFPSRYDVSAARQHRWVRGDWQLLPWIFGFRFKNSNGARRSAIPLMGRWKLLDNLRRSLSAPAAFLGMLIALFQPIAAAEIWTAYILLTIALPPLLPAIASIVPLRRGVSLRNHLRSIRGDFALGLVQSAFLITFLAHQAWLMVDAMMRTLFRLFISRRHLLQWATASQTKDDFGADQRGLVVQVTECVAFAGLVAIALYFSGRQTWLLASPFAALWVLSPLVARWASLPPPGVGHLSITPADASALRLIARRTWWFFEKFVTAEDNMLPPDNFQEDPDPVIAHRTSPTNLGLYLLSIIAARDFGWLGTLDALGRLEGAFKSMEKLERFRGHFYNWYDTSDLDVLEPKYVSSVDSGNLAGHLIALSNACREIAAGPAAGPNWPSGLEDCLTLVRDSARLLAEGEKGAPSAARVRLNGAIDALAASLRNAPAKPAEIAKRLFDMAPMADALVECARARSLERGGAADAEIIVWAEAVRNCILAHRSDIDFLTPWASLLATEILAGDEVVASLDTMPTLTALPTRCKAASQMLANRPRDGGGEDLARLVSALAKSASAAQMVLVARFNQFERI